MTKETRLVEWSLIGWIVLIMATLAVGCTPPTAPTQRNPDGTVHHAGDPLQPWIPTVNAPITDRK